MNRYIEIHKCTHPAEFVFAIFMFIAHGLTVLYLWSLSLTEDNSLT